MAYNQVHDHVQTPAPYAECTEPFCPSRYGPAESRVSGQKMVHVRHSNDPSKPLSSSGWSLQSLLSKSNNFKELPRIHASEHDLSRSIREYESNGLPVIVEGWHELPNWPNKFNINWFIAQSSLTVAVRNVHDTTDTRLTLLDCVERLRNGPKGELYGKDLDCPVGWRRWLSENTEIPSFLLPDADANLLNALPEGLHVETLMCYMGAADSFTACHKDLCGSTGQNLMCYSENGGSSFWFMTESSSSADVAEYFHKLGEELDHETYPITVQELAGAPFTVYIGEQKLGDLVLIPPRSCHQVVNHGGITIKTSWSRMTLQGLSAAYYYELPIYRRVCRTETYKVKLLVYYALVKMCSALSSTSTQFRPELAQDTQMLIRLYDDILIEEYCPHHASMRCERPGRQHDHDQGTSMNSSRDTDGGILCDFCGADIFQSFFECKICKHPSSDCFTICPGCYAEGRSCRCEIMEPVQCRPFQNLLDARGRAVEALKEHLHRVNQPLEVEVELNFNTASSTFWAACILLDARRRSKVKNEERTCSQARHHPVSNSHVVAYPAALHCKKCHASKCYQHILLDQRMHIVDAILKHNANSTHPVYHGNHLGNKNRYLNGQPIYSRKEKQGLRPDLAHQRAYMALTYRTCKPLCPSFMKAGWYDVQVQYIAESKEPPPSVDMSTDLDDNPSDASTSILSTLSEAPLANALRPKRAAVLRPRLRPYVKVPPLPYRVKEQMQSNPPKSVTLRNSNVASQPLRLSKPLSPAAKPRAYTVTSSKRPVKPMMEALKHKAQAVSEIQHKLSAGNLQSTKIGPPKRIRFFKIKQSPASPKFASAFESSDFSAELADAINSSQGQSTRQSVAVFDALPLPTLHQTQQQGLPYIERAPTFRPTTNHDSAHAHPNPIPQNEFIPTPAVGSFTVNHPNSITAIRQPSPITVNPHSSATADHSNSVIANHLVAANHLDPFTLGHRGKMPDLTMRGEANVSTSGLRVFDPPERPMQEGIAAAVPQNSMTNLAKDVADQVIDRIRRYEIRYEVIPRSPVHTSTEKRSEPSSTARLENVRREECTRQLYPSEHGPPIDRGTLPNFGYQWLQSSPTDLRTFQSHQIHTRQPFPVIPKSRRYPTHPKWYGREQHAQKFKGRDTSEVDMSYTSHGKRKLSMLQEGDIDYATPRRRSYRYLGRKFQRKKEYQHHPQVVHGMTKEFQRRSYDYPGKQDSPYGYGLAGSPKPVDRPTFSRRTGHSIQTHPSFAEGKYLHRGEGPNPGHFDPAPSPFVEHSFHYKNGAHHLNHIPWTSPPAESRYALENGAAQSLVARSPPPPVESSYLHGDRVRRYDYDARASRPPSYPNERGVRRATRFDHDNPRHCGEHGRTGSLSSHRLHEEHSERSAQLGVRREWTGYSYNDRYSDLPTLASMPETSPRTERRTPDREFRETFSRRRNSVPVGDTGGVLRPPPPAMLLRGMTPRSEMWEDTYDLDEEMTRRDGNRLPAEGEDARLRAAMPSTKPVKDAMNDPTCNPWS